MRRGRNLRQRAFGLPLRLVSLPEETQISETGDDFPQIALGALTSKQKRKKGENDLRGSWAGAFGRAVFGSGTDSVVGCCLWCCLRSW